MTAASPVRLARRAGRGYAAGMMSRFFLLLFVSASLVASDDSHRAPAKRPVSSSAKIRSGMRDVWRKTEKAFRSVGGHIEKFFTGRDTVSR